MADTSLTQPSFTAGEVAPALYGRKDLARYQVGARKMSNVFVHAHGGASNRAGLKFAAEVPDSTKTTRITTFEAAEDEAFLMVWSDHVMRPMFHGAYLDAGGGVPYEIITPYPSPDLAKLYMEQSNDVLTLVHPLHAVRELGRYDSLDWRISNVTFAPGVPAPIGLTAVGTEGYTGYDGSHSPEFKKYKVSAVGENGEESLPSEAVTSDIALVLGYEKNFVTISWSTEGVTTEGSDTPSENKANEGLTQVDRTWSLDNGKTVSKIGAYLSDAFNITLKIVQRTGASTYTVLESHAFAHPGGGWADFTLPVPFVVPGVDHFVAVYGSARDVGLSSRLRSSIAGDVAVGAGVTITDGTSHVRATRATYAATGIDTSAVPIESYNVYKAENDIYGYIGRTTNTTFKDTNFDPSFSQGPQSGANPFVGEGNYPSVVTFCQQRRAFANTLNQPQTVFETQAGNFNNMGTATPIRDDDAIEFTLASKLKQDVYHMVALDKGMIVFTRSGEWKVTGREGDVITPASVFPSPQSAYGANRYLKPLIAGEQMLFSADNKVLEMGYSLDADRYVGNDLTILASHLFEGRSVVAWDYAASPHSIIWCVMNDGKMVSLTYLKEHDVWGWGRHETSGRFLDTAVVPEDGRDVPYFVVRRRIGGVAKQYIEYMADRQVQDVRDAFFVDSGLSLDNPVEIEAISLGTTTTFTSTAHGLAIGDTIELDGLSIYDDDEDLLRSLDGRWIVAGVTANTFTLEYEYGDESAVPPIEAGDGLDTSGEATGYYDGTGVFRKGFITVGGLSHLEGRKVSVLADGNVIEGKTVSGGSVMLDDVMHFRVHVGLAYRAVLGTLDLYNSQGDDTGVTKGIPTVFLRLDRTRGLKVGRVEDDVEEEIYTREDEDYEDPAALQNGLYKVSLWEEWAPDQSLFVVQDYPLPMTILGITLKVQYGGE